MLYKHLDIAVVHINFVVLHYEKRALITNVLLTRRSLFVSLERPSVALVGDA